MMFHSVLLGVQIRGGGSKSASGFGPGGGSYPWGSKSAVTPDLLLVSIFVKSSIDVHQIARKRESFWKDLDIIDRRLHNMLMNGSLFKRFRFSEIFRLGHYDFLQLDLSSL